jgi:hypothetical protein
MSWTYSVPPDLRRQLEGVLGQRNCGAAEIWGEVRDWLVANKVPFPDGLEVERADPATAHRDQ